MLADSGIEHYRGDFHNPAMVLPLISSTASILASLDGATRNERAAHPLRLSAYGAAMVVGALGTGFHLYNVTKKPGGLSWENLFYQAPIGAPGALLLSGLLGLAAEGIRDHEEGAPAPKLLGAPAAQALAGLTSLGLIGTTVEVALLHFRGNFQNPAMYLPVALPPIAAALTAEAVLYPDRRPRPQGETLARHHGGTRRRGRGVPCLRHLPLHGWLEELAAESRRRAADPGAAEFLGPRPRRARGPGPPRKAWE